MYIFCLSWYFDFVYNLGNINLYFIFFSLVHAHMHIWNFPVLLILSFSTIVSKMVLEEKVAHSFPSLAAKACIPCLFKSIHLLLYLNQNLWRCLHIVVQYFSYINRKNGWSFCCGLQFCSVLNSYVICKIYLSQGEDLLEITVINK